MPSPYTPIRLEGVSTTSANYACTEAQLAEIAGLVNDPSVAASICQQLDVAQLGTTNAVVSWLSLALAKSKSDVAEVAHGLNTNFLLTSAYQVFLMQAGFALYAAGVIRTKNTTTILLKNMIDACIGGIAFYLIGYGLAYGNRGTSNGFIGNWDFALSETSVDFPSRYSFWFWNWAFAAASTTILSGSIAERSTFHSYVIYSFFMTTWVYPVVVHWLWSKQGWLSAYNPTSILGSGAIDFSGSGVVHMVGGFASLVAAIITGPRTGRFDGTQPAHTFRGHSPALYCLGVFLLWFGWFGFNPGSHQAIDTYTHASGVGRTAATTALAGAAGAVASLFLGFWRTHTWDLLQVCTGCLAGLVAITAGCGVVEPWAAIIIGILAAPIYIYGEVLMEWLQIDDPVGAFPVHGMCGVWGVLSVGFFGAEKYIMEVYDKPAGKHLMGVFYGGHGQLLLCQLIAVLVIMAWSSFWIAALFKVIDHFGALRVPLADEAMGLDSAACGESSKHMNPHSLTKFIDASIGHSSAMRLPIQNRHAHAQDLPVRSHSSTIGISPFAAGVMHATDAVSGSDTTTIDIQMAAVHQSTSAAIV